MSKFKNVSAEDREVQVDGRRIPVPVGGTFEVADEFDSQLLEQPHFEIERKSTKAQADPTEGEK